MCYGQKKGLWPLKVKNHPNFLTCRWHETYHWKALDEDYNFALDLTSIRSLHTKLWAPKVARIPTLGILGLPPGQNDIWVPVPWPGTKYTIMKKVVASPKFGPWWVLWVRVCPWLISAPKCSNYALTNLLFVLCRFMWVIDLLVNLPSFHPGASTCPSTPEVLQAKECAPTPPSIVFTFGFTIESIKELGGASVWMTFFLFKEFLAFFKKFIPSGMVFTNQHLLVLDGHGNHVTLKTIKHAQEFGLGMITLPSHTSYIL